MFNYITFISTRHVYFYMFMFVMVLRGCVILISTFSAIFQVGIWPPDWSRVCFLNCWGFLGQFVFAENSPGAESHWSYLQKQPHRRKESVPCPTAPPSRSETDWTPHQIYTEGERDASDVGQKWKCEKHEWIIPDFMVTASHV